MKTIYSCGPTVYERAHIGNLRAMSFADHERKKLEAEDHIVKHVMNITDIDDKIIKAVGLDQIRFDPKLHLSVLRDFTEPLIQQFKGDLIKIGIDITKISFVNATDYYYQMKEYAMKLFREKKAYISKGSIVLDTSKISDYKSQGEDPDFALWKLDKNRPGWHLECTVMSRNCLGAGFDLHTGGIDLKFPHHYNENAQSIAYDNHKLCNDYHYCEHLLIEGQKMSKSLGNVFTLDDVEKRGFTGNNLRKLFDKYTYSNILDFSWDKLEKTINPDYPNLINDLNGLRAKFRKEKNYVMSDTLRQILVNNNISVNDK